jgi:predicted SAM-dependent methyltransferase
MAWFVMIRGVGRFVQWWRSARASRDLRRLHPMPRRLNIGCGHDKRAGYLNIDVDPACAPDLLIRGGDYSAIPFNYFDEIVAKDVLEHIGRADTLSALLDWASWLKIGGTIEIETSSILGVAEMLRAKSTV